MTLVTLVSLSKAYPSGIVGAWRSHKSTFPDSVRLYKIGPLRVDVRLVAPFGYTLEFEYEGVPQRQFISLRGVSVLWTALLNRNYAGDDT